MKKKGILLFSLCALCAVVLCAAIAVVALFAMEGGDPAYADMRVFENDTYRVEVTGDTYVLLEKFVLLGTRTGKYDKSLLGKDITLKNADGFEWMTLDDSWIKVDKNTYQYRPDGLYGNYDEIILNPRDHSYALSQWRSGTAMSYELREDVEVLRRERDNIELHFRNGECVEGCRLVQGWDMGTVSKLDCEDYTFDFIAVPVDDGLFVMEISREAELPQIAVEPGLSDAVVKEYRIDEAVFCLMEDGSANISTQLRWYVMLDRLAEGIWGNGLYLVTIEGDSCSLYYQRGAFDTAFDTGKTGIIGRIVPQVAEGVYQDDKIRLSLMDGQYSGYIVDDAMVFIESSIMKAVSPTGEYGGERLTLVYEPGKKLGYRGDGTAMCFEIVDDQLLLTLDSGTTVLHELRP